MFKVLARYTAQKLYKTEIRGNILMRYDPQK